MATTDRPPVILFLLLPLISVLILAPTVIYPYGRDQGIFGYAGHAVLGGGVPFRDFWDPKPPALYYVYALAELVFGYSMASIRLFDLLWQAATAVIICRITRRVSGSGGTAFAAGLIYVLAYASNGWWNTAQPDDFLNLPLAGAVLLTLRACGCGRSPGISFCIGLLTACAFYFKYPMGAMLPVCMACLAAARGVRGAAADIACMAAGFVLAAVGYSLYLFGAGAWREFLYAEFVWVRQYARLGEGAGGFGGLLHLRDIANSHFSFVSLGALALAGGAWAAVRRHLNPAAGLAALWAAVALLNLYIQNKFYIYHFAPLLAPLSIGAATVVAAPFGGGNRPGLRLAAALGAVAAIVVSYAAINPRYNAYCLKTYADTVRACVSRALGGKPLDDYYRNVRFTSDDFSLPADLAVAEYLDRNTAGNDTVFVWGYETLVYYLARRQCPSRFIHNFPLRCAWVPARFGDELLASLDRERPKYILVLMNDPAWWATGTREDSLQALRRYPAIGAFIGDRYAHEGRIEDFLLFRLKDRTGKGGGDAR